ncbi:iron-sulfur cluster assembly accessory protein [Buchnera aphidicola]|uniref:Iron-sulfur cluster assembly accessory protein n=1 Tax=Buchnera aphidicola (Therioaphis trifolii) TaxID=1241884 RepID=A0A4D6YM97_9GAMM|nr:iron-sulfur cluster assembly accessory protein [Buchnera aphidicola]QCI27094.1 iron-sulfur cluster assembly accessory protein [Buchnera aphidicola (Therioaphis trifolii)]
MNSKKWIGIKLTKLAQKYFTNLIHKNKNTIGIKINIKKSGCAGFKYNLLLININNQKEINKSYIYIKNNIKIYIPITDMPFIDGTIIDFITTDGINMNIQFNNPQINEYCGCGSSFYIKNVNKINKI